MEKESRNKDFVVRLQEIGMDDVGLVGGKNASLGEMIRNLSQKGIRVPGGFVVTVEGHRYFLRETKLDEFIQKTLVGLDTKNLKDLARRGAKIRNAIRAGAMPKDLEDAIVREYENI